MGLFVKIGNVLQMAFYYEQGETIFVIGIHSNEARRLEFTKIVALGS